MRPPPIALIIFSLIGISPLAGTAQDAHLMKVGDLVRLRIKEGQTYSRNPEGPLVSSGSLVVGKVRSVSDVVVLLGMEGERFEIPAFSIEMAQVSIGKRTNTFKGLGLGVLIGGGSGIALGFLLGDDPSGCWIMCATAREKALLAGGALGVIGGIFGLFAGALTESDAWEDLSISGVEASGHMGRNGRIGLGFSFPRTN